MPRFSLLALWSCLILETQSYALCDKITLPLDEEFRDPRITGHKLTRDTTYFMLEGIVNDPAAVKNEGDKWTIDCDALHQPAIEPLNRVLSVDGTMDPTMVRDIFERYYLKTIAMRGQDIWIKPSLTEMTTVTKFKEWPKQIVRVSMIKRKARRIYRSPEGINPPIHVSETLDSTSGEVPGAKVLETEVAVMRDSGSWDFYAYNEAGNLVNYSTFPAGQRPSPRICMNCHYDPHTGKIDQFFFRGFGY